MNISFYIVLIGLALLISSAVLHFARHYDEDIKMALFGIGAFLCTSIIMIEFAVTNDSMSCAIDDRRFTNVTCIVKPNEKPVNVVYYQKCLFKKTEMKNEKVLPGQVKIFKHSIIVSKDEIDLQF